MSIDPKILKRMQGEDTFLQSQTRGSRRVKLNRGQNWVVRFLPARLGPDELFFARIARHWLNKLPIICPRNTSPDYGGDPDCECPVCEVAEELNASANEAVSKVGYQAKSTPQFLTYCIVWEKDGVQQPMSEVLNPYEFWHYRSTWEELKGFYVGGGRKSQDSVLDYVTGNDFSVSKGAKGMRLDKQDTSPIFDAKDPKYNEWIKKIESALKTPKVTIPTFQQLQVFADKVQEAAHRGGAPADDGPRRRPARDDDDAADEASFRRPSRRPAAEGEEDDIPYDQPTPLARNARRAAPEEEAEEPAPRRRPAAQDDDPTPRRRAAVEEQEEPAPRRRAAPVEDQEEPAPRRRAAEPAEEAEEPTPRAATRRPAQAAEEAEEAPARRPAPTARRAAPAAEAEEPEPDGPGEEPEPEAADVAPARKATPAPGRKLEPTARRTSEAANSAPQAEAEEEDPLPEDDKDPVPPAPKRTARSLEQESEADEPPPVARKGGMGAAIADRLNKLPRGA